VRDRKQIEALVYLLGDEDKFIYQEVRRELLSLGCNVLPIIEEEIKKHSTKIKVRAKQIINCLQTSKQPRQNNHISAIT